MILLDDVGCALLRAQRHTVSQVFSRSSVGGNRGLRFRHSSLSNEASTTQALAVSALSRSGISCALLSAVADRGGAFSRLPPILLAAIRNEF